MKQACPQTSPHAIYEASLSLDKPAHTHTHLRTWVVVPVVVALVVVEVEAVVVVVVVVVVVPAQGMKSCMVAYDRCERSQNPRPHAMEALAFVKRSRGEYSCWLQVRG